MRDRVGLGMTANTSILCLAALLFGCQQPVERAFVTDDQGRAMILHGVNPNADAKGDILGVGSKTREDYLRLSEDWGFNVVRFLVFCASIEPEPGVIDWSYLDRVAERLAWCAEADLHVIFDMHQDVYSCNFPGFNPDGCVNGAPAWAIEDDGLPARWQDPWWITNLQPGVMAAWDNFWDDFEGVHGRLQEHFIDAFVALAERFHDDPIVIGYVLYNEPFMGHHGIFTFEKQVLQPFYERLIEAIRTVDSSNWIFYEPISMGINQGMLRSRLGEVEDFRPGGRRLGYMPHLYTIDIDLTGGYGGNPFFIHKWERDRVIDVAEQGVVPMLIGEVGLSGEMPNALDYLAEVMAMADRITSGWTYWDYSNGSWGQVYPDGSERPKINVLVRPYPRAIAGEPIGWEYDPETRLFSLSFDEKPGVEGPTEIYVPAGRFYADGWKLSVSDPDGRWRCEWDEDREILDVHTDPGEESHTILIGPDPGGPGPECGSGEESCDSCGCAMIGTTTPAAGQLGAYLFLLLLPVGFTVWLKIKFK